MTREEFEDSIKLQERDKCCALICEYCSDAKDFSTYKIHKAVREELTNGNYWTHLCETGSDTMGAADSNGRVKCLAWKIKEDSFVDE